MEQSFDLGTRKLAAVMFTDIKGFSKKMSENESAAFELLKTHDALMRVITAKHEGKVVKSIGDSFMIDFSSAVNAVKAAIDAQKRFWNFNKGKVEFDRIEIRIGIHLGDVMVADNDMYGDGVNIASRIEAITEPNRICISADMYNQVKNKTDLRVYRIGEMQLKNIPNPVEIYEVLIDSIPELAEPSITAQQASKKEHVEDVTDQETAEAKRIEAKKKRGSTAFPKGHDTASVIEAHYQWAEQLYNDGKIEEAERVIEEIAKIDPSYYAAMEQTKVGEEQVHEHYQKAGAYLRDGLFDLAEKEVEEIFKMFPLHVGAQQLQLQIDEERYKQVEKERQQRLDLELKKREKTDRRLDELARRAEEYIEQENFPEARDALQDILALESTYTGIERLEEKFRRAEAAKLERDRAQAFLDEQQHKEEVLALNRERQAEMHQKRAQRQRQPGTSKRFALRFFRFFIRFVVGTVLVLVAYVAYPRIKKIVFPISASVVVLPLSVNQDEPTEDALRFVISDLLAQELARVERLRVVSPYALNVRSSENSKIAADHQVRYVINGIFKRTDQIASIVFRLYDSERQSVLLSEKFETDFRSLPRNLVTVVGRFRQQLGMDPVETRAVRTPSNARSYEVYLHGLHQLRQRTPAGLEQARRYFLEAASLDSSFGSPLARLSELIILKYRNSVEPDEALLSEAFELNQRALSLDNQEAVCYRNLGSISFLTRRFDKVFSNVARSLSLQPEDAECYRLLALLSLVGANPDASYRNAIQYVRLAPDNPDASLVLGLAQHYKKMFVAAMASYQKAISLGLSDSLVTVDYLLQTWSGQENYDAVIQQCQKILQLYPNDYRYVYRICRAYQMMPKIDAFKEWAERGITQVRRRLDKNMQDPVAHAYLALLLAREGKPDEAEAEMAKATALAPGSTEILFRRANLYAILKKPGPSLTSLREALNRDYSFPEIMNPDFVYFKSDTAFASAVTRRLQLK